MLCIDLIKRQLNRDEQQFNCEQQNEPLVCPASKFTTQRLKLIDIRF
jgi:hypothetical protein